MRITQTKLILEIIIDELLAKLKTKQAIANQLTNILKLLKSPTHTELTPGYTAGNILNLLAHLQIDLTNYDFSHLTIWQAYLQDTPLHNVNFSHSDLANSIFAKIFSTIMSIAFSPDGQILATGYTDGLLCLWNINNSQQIISYQSHIGAVWSMIFSPHSDILFTGGHDQKIKLWDVKTGECLQTLSGHESGIYAVLLTPNHETLISGGNDGTIRYWQLSSGKYLKKWQAQPQTLTTVAISPDGEILATAGNDNRIYLWELKTTKHLKTLIVHDAWIVKIAISSQGILASSSLDQTIRLWNIQTGECIGILSGHTNGVLAVTFLGSENLLASCGVDNTVRIWDIETQKCLRNLQGHNNSLNTIAANLSGSIIASGGDDFSIRLWNTSNGKCIRNFQARINWVAAIDFHPLPHQNQWSFASGSADKTVKLWNLQGKYCTLSGHEDYIFSLDFSPDGKMLVSGDVEGNIKIWNMQTRKSINSFQITGLYEKMNIYNVQGLTAAQKSSLFKLGAVNHG